MTFVPVNGAFIRKSLGHILPVQRHDDVDSPVTKEFFATVQNKLHYAITKHTAAEIIYDRADSTN